MPKEPTQIVAIVTSRLPLSLGVIAAGCRANSFNLIGPRWSICTIPESEHFGAAAYYVTIVRCGDHLA
jgi:hypothetical protein